ncbi:Protein of unknown function [Pyronema omphalodes CBS 100304]|uniref:Uncharacterized protein n=1 Tax=Pyronema omphalodes (strain CBS 100304) TaxID=1076935 RepID=U4L513_PYROM|nr:Protein of unknown function [Pyronema omphalodes CBS 100304]
MLAEYETRGVRGYVFAVAFDIFEEWVRIDCMDWKSLWRRRHILLNV